jgi:hypothetical protein
MKIRHTTKWFLLLVLLITNSCVGVIESQKKEYGLLESAVTYSAEKVIGEYGDAMPNDFTAEKFLLLIHDKIPREYYDTLLRYRLELKPMGSYYLLLVFDPRNTELILFDYSCTSEVDGPVILEPQKYDLNNLNLYDTCAQTPN